MHKLSVFLISAFILSIGVLFDGCSKENDDSQTDPNAKALFDLTTLTNDTKARFLEIAPQVNGDPKQALMQTMDWVLQQEGVVNAYHFDSTYLQFETSTGLKSMFWFNELDENGNSKYRGSGSGALKALISENGCSNEIENKNALIWAPAYDEFLYPIASGVPYMFDTSSIIKDVEKLKNEYATADKITTFSNYGFVLIATHGTPSSFMTGTSYSFVQTEVPKDYDEFLEAVRVQVGQENLDRLVSGKLTISTNLDYDRFNPEWWELGGWESKSTYILWASSKFLEDISTLSNTIVYGGFCFSGWISPIKNVLPDPIGQAFIDKKPITYYAYQRPDGWSRKVDNLESIALEDSTIRSLIADNESTGEAHLQHNGSQFNTTFPDLFLTQMEHPDWCYEGCGDVLVDSRDGQTYPTVCIGDLEWMAESLRYDTAGSFCYDDNPANCNTLGRMYLWQTALVVCPDGWRLPTETEFTDLIDELGGQAVAGGKLKATTGWNSPNVGATNSSGFSALGSGEHDESGFAHIGQAAYFWSSTPNADWVRLLYLNNANSEARIMNRVQQTYFPTYSIRCVKEK